MKTLDEMYLELRNGGLDAALKAVYADSDEADRQKKRLCGVMDSFAALFGCEREISLFRAPGRTEVGGNHTDHNHGRVLAAGINLDAVAAASKNDENVVRVKSEGHDMNVVGLSSLTPAAAETGRSSALVRGVCAGFVQCGYNVGGFDAATASDVLSGSGLSSSAAFEVLVGTILNHLYNDGRVSGVEIAQIAQYAENEFFGKPCGLMDQTASAVGGFIIIDFRDPKKPVIEKLDFDFASCGHSLCIVDTGGSHASLTDEYAAVRGEMISAAKVFGRDVLCDVPESLFWENISRVRELAGDRAVLRAMHFYGDNERVLKEVAALKNGDFEEFKRYVIESGRSSYMYNQNVYACQSPQSQSVSLALAMSEKLLNGRGAWRVHGGGFAGTIQAFVPGDLLDTYKAAMEAVFGVGSCKALKVSPVGGTRLCREG
ncbi:MAG: galactokinase [Oscillospiraceae bacterium]|nr:galactokinase [Oscillospiraceae bacterium]